MCSFFCSMQYLKNRDLHLSSQFPAANRPTSSWIGEKTERETENVVNKEGNVGGDVPAAAWA